MLRVFLVLTLMSTVAAAMDYADSPEARQSPSQDLGNLYTWYDSTTDRISVLLTLGPTTSRNPMTIFEQRGKYRIHIDNDNDLQENIYFDFFFGGTDEFVATTGPETLRGKVGLVAKADNWQAFAGVVVDPAFGDYAALSQFFNAKYPCSPTATTGLRCGGESSVGPPANAFTNQNTGLMAISFNASKFGVAAASKINVWGTSWAVQ